MLLSMDQRDRENLSKRTRAFVRIHHCAVLGLIAWITYLFTVSTIL